MTVSPLALRIARGLAEQISIGELAPGSHLASEAIAAHFGVSRTPVRDALRVLCDRRLIEQRPNRGYFVRDAPPRPVDITDGPAASADLEDMYYAFAEDWLNDRIDSQITEHALRDRYKLTKAQTQDVLTRAAREGWAEPKPGYGWALRPVAKTADAFEQIYRFRAVIEPAALLEPTFAVDRAVFSSLRGQQQKLLDTDISRLRLETVKTAGIVFHEALARMSGNPLYFQALERANQLRRLIEYRLKVDRARLQAQCLDHLHLLDLLEQADTLEAAHFMKRHLIGALARKAPDIAGLSQ